MSMKFQRGEFVKVIYRGQTIQAMVLLASTNGRSLMLGFDGALWSAGGMFFGSMPVFQDEDNGPFFDLMEPRSPVQIERLPRHD